MHWLFENRHLPGDMESSVYEIVDRRGSVDMGIRTGAIVFAYPLTILVVIIGNAAVRNSYMVGPIALFMLLDVINNHYCSKIQHAKTSHMYG